MNKELENAYKLLELVKEFDPYEGLSSYDSEDDAIKDFIAQGVKSAAVDTWNCFYDPDILEDGNDLGYKKAIEELKELIKVA